MNESDKTRLKTWSVVISVFLLGGITGASLDSAYRSRVDDGRHGMHDQRKNGESRFERMRRELNLDDEQAAQVRSILEEAQNDFRLLRDETRPRHDAVRQTSRTRIRAILRPDQQRLFDAKVAKQDARDKERVRPER